jgi:hypothetical protein
VVAVEPAVAEKVAALAPALIITLDGTVRAVLFACRLTEVAVAADVFNTTVHVALWPAPSEDGAHPSEVSCTGAVKVKEAGADDPLAAAVKVALWLVETAATLAVKPALD